MIDGKEERVTAKIAVAFCLGFNQCFDWVKTMTTDDYDISSVEKGQFPRCGVIKNRTSFFKRNPCVFVAFKTDNSFFLKKPLGFKVCLHFAFPIISKNEMCLPFSIFSRV